MLYDDINTMGKDIRPRRFGIPQVVTDRIHKESQYSDSNGETSSQIVIIPFPSNMV